MTNKLATIEKSPRNKDTLAPFREALVVEDGHGAMQEAVIYFIATDKLFFFMSLSEPFRKKLERTIKEGISEGEDILEILKEGLSEIRQRENLAKQTPCDDYTMQTICLCIFLLECGKEKQITTEMLKKLFSNHLYSILIFHSKNTTGLMQHMTNMIRQSRARIKQSYDIPTLQALYAVHVVIGLPMLAIANYVKNRVWNTIAKKRSDRYANLISDLYEQAAINEGKDSKSVIDFLKPKSEDRVYSAVAYGTDFPIAEKGKETLVDPQLPNIIIVGIAEDYFDLAKEMDRQGEANILIIDDYQIDLSGKKITIKNGVLYKNGKAYSIHFQNPIKPDYMFHHQPHSEIHNLTNFSHIPTAGSLEVSWMTDNKEVLRKIMSDSGIENTPHICWKSLHSREIQVFDAMHIEYKKSARIEDIQKDLELFCLKNSCTEIVVKPSNAGQGYGVSFFKDTELKEAAKAVSDIEKKGFGVIVEKRIVAAPLTIDKEQKDWNLRVFMTRDEDKHTGPTIGDILVRIDTPGKPVNISISAKVMTLPDVLKQMNISEEKIEKLMRDINEFTEKCYIAVYKFAVDYFKIVPNIDFLGVDIVISEINGELKVNLIEINDHGSGGMYDLSKILPPEEQGRASRKLATWVIKQATIYKNIISKSRELPMK